MNLDPLIVKRAQHKHLDLSGPSTQPFPAGRTYLGLTVEKIAAGRFSNGNDTSPQLEQTNKKCANRMIDCGQHGKDMMQKSTRFQTTKHPNKPTNKQTLFTE